MFEWAGPWSLNQEGAWLLTLYVVLCVSLGALWIYLHRKAERSLQMREAALKAAGAKASQEASMPSRLGRGQLKRSTTTRFVSKVTEGCWAAISHAPLSSSSSRLGSSSIGSVAAPFNVHLETAEAEAGVSERGVATAPISHVSSVLVQETSTSHGRRVNSAL